MSENDSLHRFIFENCAVRGEWVHLDASWQALKANADYPAVVEKVLGEAVAAVALLAATVKFNGSLTLQLKGSGYIRMLVVQATGERTLRGVAHWDESDDADPSQLFGADTQLVMTLEPGEGKERYQGLVELTGNSIADAVQAYFVQSEQLPTRIWLAGNSETVAGLLLQELPKKNDEDEDAWDRLVMLAETVKDEELIELSSEELLHRLYHEEVLRLFEREVISFRCACSSEKVEGMIRSMGIKEARDILEEEGNIRVECEFCRTRYEYDAVDIEGLFAGSHDASVSKHSH